MSNRDSMDSSRRTNKRRTTAPRNKANGRDRATSSSPSARRATRSGAPLTVSRPELLVDGTDREFRKLVHGLFTFFALHTAIRDGYAAALGLPGPQYTILLCVRNLSDAGPV